ncbi:MAG TPA: SDR family oxidoreductase [Thermoanaerobaculaceae bacterium]|nr:SDR family oxidoreductase [Thermoanaerobaculaceae bacterium]
MSVVQGSTVLITGGASGIGRRLAELLARRGARLVLWDIHEPSLRATVEDLRAQHGADARGYVCDVTDRGAVYSMSARVRAEVGSVDILVNNAGVVSGKSFSELPDEMIERTFQVNALAPFWTCKAFLPDMIERGRGHLVTVASAAGLVGVPRLVDYSASKWAAVGFNEALRMELRRTAPGVRTTVVCPFYVSTGMFAGARSQLGFLLPILKPEKVAARIVEAIEKDRPKLVLPAFVRLVPLLRLLPIPWLDAFARLLGVSSSMDHFVGRDGAAGE